MRDDLCRIIRDYFRKGCRIIRRAKFLEEVPYIPLSSLLSRKNWEWVYNNTHAAGMYIIVLTSSNVTVTLVQNFSHLQEESLWCRVAGIMHRVRRDVAEC